MKEGGKEGKSRRPAAVNTPPSAGTHGGVCPPLPLAQNKGASVSIALIRPIRLPWTLLLASQPPVEVGTHLPQENGGRNLTIALANRFLRARKRGSCKANTTSSVSQQRHLYKPGAHAVSKPLLLHQQATISAISPQSPHNGRGTNSCSRQGPGFLSFLFTGVSSSSIDASHQHPGHQSRRLSHVSHSGIVPACHVPPTLPTKRLCTKHELFVFQAANQRCKPTRFCRQAYMTRTHRRVSSEILHIKKHQDTIIHLAMNSVFCRQPNSNPTDGQGGLSNRDSDFYPLTHPRRGEV